MLDDERMSASPSPAAKRIYRLGGVSALVFAIGYVLIIALYVVAGAPPTTAQAWLNYLAGRTTTWSAIVGLSVLTDVLLLPVALSLYYALGRVDRNGLFVGLGLIGLFVVMDLAVTWPNYSSLIFLSGQYASATSDAQRAAIVAAANYPSSVLSSKLEGVYSILTLSLGILLVGIVMRKGVFGKTTAYLGMITGMLGIVSVAGPFLQSSLGQVVIIASVLTTVWLALAGYRLFTLSRE